MEEGIVPGGGVALLYASKTLEEVKGKNASFDQKIGVDIVQKALQMPLKTIANNAGAPGRPALYTPLHTFVPLPNCSSFGNA